MRITITGRNIDITDGLRSAVEDKLSKLEKYFTPDTDVFVTLSVEKRKTENRGHHTGKRKYHPFRAGQQRYVCFHRSGRRGHRASA